MAGIRRALAVATGERYFSLLANFGVLAAVSRLMTPAEIGVAVLGSAASALLLSVAREFGSVSFLIQHKDLSPERMRSAVTVMAVLSLAVALTQVACARRIALWYGQETLEPFLYLTAAGLMLELVAQPLLALLRRDMAFGRSAMAGVAGVGATAAVTTGLALAGQGSISFAWGLFAGSAVTAAVALAATHQAWIFRPRFTGWSEMLAFGGLNGANVVLYRLYEALPPLLLGQFAGPRAVAFLNRATLVCQMPDKIILGGVVAVALPAFSAEARRGGDLKRPYLFAIRLITAVQWPALVGLALLADPVVRVLLGAQWQEIVPLVRLLSAALLFSFAFELNYPIMIAVGAMRATVLRGLIAWPVSAVILAVGSLWGLQGVATSMLVAVPFQAFVSFSFVKREITLTWGEIARAAAASLPPTLGAAAGPILVAAVLGFRLDFDLPQAAAAIALALPGWALGLRLVSHPLMEEVVRMIEPAIRIGRRRMADGA